MTFAIQNVRENPDFSLARPAARSTRPPRLRSGKRADLNRRRGSGRDARGPVTVQPRKGRSVHEEALPRGPPSPHALGSRSGAPGPGAAPDLLGDAGPREGAPRPAAAAPRRGRQGDED